MLDGSTLRLHSQASPYHRTAQRKAAALHHSLNKNHPFVDGNKRLAVAAMEWFLFRNGFALMATNEQVFDFALRVAKDDLSRDESARWIERRALRDTWRAERIFRFFAALSSAELREAMSAPASPGFAHEQLRAFVRDRPRVGEAPP